MLGTALLCSKNQLLLETRARLLNIAEIDSTVTSSIQEFELLQSQRDFGLVVLGQTLTNEEIELAVPIVRRRWPKAKILIFHMMDQRREDIPKAVELLASPQ
jgi:hypothetical protein